MDFDFPKSDIKIDVEALKEKARKHAAEVKSQAAKAKAKAAEAMKKDSVHIHWDSDDFINGVSENMKAFGKSMERWGENFEKNMGQWSKDFEKSMEKFSEKMEQFGEHLDEELSDRIKVYTSRMNDHWSGEHTMDDYSKWQLESLFSDLYDESQAVQNADRKPERFYEVQVYDLKTPMNDQLLFIGCQIDEAEDIPHSFVTQHLTAEKWLVAKMTKEEYLKDWLHSLEKVEKMKDYEIEQYFIIRHFKDKQDQKTKKIKVYIPLKSKA